MGEIFDRGIQVVHAHGDAGALEIVDFPALLFAAAGGFEANIEWLKEHWGDAADNFLIRGTPYNRGSILKMLLAKGVQEVGDPKQCHAVAIDARAPKFDGGIITRHDSVVFGIVVNNGGLRFYDEGEDIWPKRYAIWGRLVAAQPDQIAYIIFDASSRNSFMPTLFPPIEAGSSSSFVASSAIVGAPMGGNSVGMKLVTTVESKIM